MMLVSDHYTYRVTWSDEDQDYVGLCNELPSLSHLASSPEVALRGIRKLVVVVIRDMQRDHEAIP
jgi:predicted RNase H-like HicB family nuclease